MLFIGGFGIRPVKRLYLWTVKSNTGDQKTDHMSDIAAVLASLCGSWVSSLFFCSTAVSSFESDFTQQVQLFCHPHPQLKRLHVKQNCFDSWVIPSEKTEKIDPPKKLNFCHTLSPLDWIMLIWAIFGLPGPPEGFGGPWGVGGLGGLKNPKFSISSWDQF